MAMAQLSPVSIQANPAHVNPQVQIDSRATPAQAAQTAHKVERAAKTDTVTISPQALKLASDGDTAAREAKESAAEKARERLRGKK